MDVHNSRKILTAIVRDKPIIESLSTHKVQYHLPESRWINHIQKTQQAIVGGKNDKLFYLILLWKEQAWTYKFMNQNLTRKCEITSSLGTKS